MLLNGGQLDGVRILSRKTVELMTQNHLKHLADPHPFGARALGFGLGVRVVTDLGEGNTVGSVGCFGWDGAATTNVQIDPKERTVALLLMQHVPFNQDDIIATFTNGYYAAIVD
jgi:CubicO group peptidase (beta-lactamase class C family)